MNKKNKSYIKLQIPSGMASPNPPIGPALGQKGINILEFCQKFNLLTKNLEKGLPIPVLVTVYQNRSFKIKIKSPPTSFLLKKFANIKNGSKKPKKENIGKIEKSKIYEIAKIKIKDTNSNNIESTAKSIIGTAYSIGLKIIED